MTALQVLVRSTGSPAPAPAPSGPAPDDTSTGRLLVLAATSLVAGVALAALSTRVGGGLAPVLVVGTPLALLASAGAVRHPLAAAALVPLALPFGFVPLAGGLLLVGQATLVLLIGVVVAHRVLAGEGPLPWPVGTGWLLLLLALVVVAVPGSDALAIAVNQTIGALIGGLVVLALVGACRGLLDVRRMVGLLLLGGGAVCATGFTQVAHVTGSATVVNGATGIFSEHNQFGAFAATVVLLALGMFLAGRSSWSRTGSLLVLAVALVAEGLALSRGAFLGTALGVVLFVVLMPRARRPVLLTLCCGALGGVLVAVFAPGGHLLSLVGRRLQSFTDATGNPEDDRPAIWAEAFRQIGMHPLFGSGPANFPVVASQTDSQISYFVPAHAHDVLLTVAAELGLPAAAVLVVLTLVWTRASVRAVRALADGRDSALVAGLAAAMSGFVGEGLFDATPRSSLVLGLMCTCAGLLLAAVRAAPGSGRHPIGGDDSRRCPPGPRPGPTVPAADPRDGRDRRFV